MVMTRKQRRLATILGCLAVAGIAIGLILYAVRDTIVYFYTPSEIAEKKISNGTRIRLGGLVEIGSVEKGETIKFSVTDNIASMKVSYRGLLPDLFREGQGVVAEGIVSSNNEFTADTVLAKHDETYMPKEVADKLKEKGVWKQ